MQNFSCERNSTYLLPRNSPWYLERDLSQMRETECNRPWRWNKEKKCLKRKYPIYKEMLPPRGQKVVFERFVLFPSSLTSSNWETVIKQRRKILVVKYHNDNYRNALNIVGDDLKYRHPLLPQKLTKAFLQLSSLSSHYNSICWGVRDYLGHTENSITEQFLPTSHSVGIYEGAIYTSVFQGLVQVLNGGYYR